MRRLFLLALVLAAPCVAAQDATAPFGFHLGLSPEGDAYALQWFSRTGGDAEVVVTDAAGAEVARAAAEADLLPEGGEYVHTALLGSLPPGDYVYAVEGREQPFVVPGEGPVKVAFLGDMGVTDAAVANVRRLMEEAPVAVFHAGDVSYAEGDPTVWDDWFVQVEPVAAGAPWLPALGNHETYFLTPFMAVAPPLYGQPNPEVTASRARFALPGNEIYWSWTVGDLHVVAVDTWWTDFLGAAEEAEWLAADLAATDARWTVVFLHDPPYSTAQHGSNVDLRAKLAPIVEAAGVDLVVAAHDHTYERSWPLLGDRVVAREAPFLEGAGVVYTVSGGGGAELYDLLDPEDWSAVRASEHHVTLVETSPTALTVRALRPDGTVLDAFAIEAPPTPPPRDAPAPTPAWGVLAGAGLLAGVAVARRAWRR